MDTDKNTWIEEVIGSLEGADRARPADDLFTKIESRIAAPESSLISMGTWRAAAAAAVLLLALNLWSLRQYSISSFSSGEEAVVSVETVQPLIPDYNLYE